MSQSLNKYHKEYSCIREVVEKEKDSITKRFTRNKRLWIAYGIILIISFFFLPIWMTSLICIGGVILFPATINNKELLKAPFLVIDIKYIQFKGKLISWNNVYKIVITHDKWKKKDVSHNISVSLKNSNGKEICVDTYYFAEQDDILKSILLLAQHKNIPIESVYPLENMKEATVL